MIEEVAWLADAREELSSVEEGPWLLENKMDASRTEE
jgi:hypothetical protein